MLIEWIVHDKLNGRCIESSITYSHSVMSFIKDLIQCNSVLGCGLPGLADAGLVGDKRF